MFVFEFLQGLLFPSLADWVSMLVTMLYSSLIAFLGAYLLQRKNGKLLISRLNQNEETAAKRILTEREYYQDILDVDPDSGGQCTLQPNDTDPLFQTVS